MRRLFLCLSILLALTCCFAPAASVSYGRINAGPAMPDANAQISSNLYNKFLASHAADSGAHSYTSSIPVLRKAVKTAPSAAVKIRCLLLLAWEEYLSGMPEEALLSAIESLAMAKQLHPSSAGIMRLNGLKSFITTNASAALDDIKKYLNANDDAAALMDDLFHLEQVRAAGRQMNELRARKASVLLDARITDWGKGNGIPEPDLEKIRAGLKKKYEMRPGMDFMELSTDLDECGKILLDELVK